MTAAPTAIAVSFILPLQAQAATVAEQTVPSGVAAEQETRQPTASTVTTATEDIIVTGSRVKRDGYSAPTPETVIGAEQIANKAPANIANFINELPQLAGSSTPRQQSATLSSGSSGANFLNLRGLGTNRTLVLLDGRRVVGSNVEGRVDINTVPSALISRVDVVTGGASAAYGSDAVSGVVNFVLDSKFTGLKLEAQSGITTYGDGFNYRLDAAGGFAFAGGRGHIVASGTYTKSQGVSEARSRPWYNGAKIVPNPAFVAGNGQPQLVLANDVNLQLATLGGIITSGVLRGTQFGQGGAVSQRVYGVNTNIFSIGGEFADHAAYFALDVPLEQTTAFTHASFDLTEDVTLFGEFNYGEAIATAPAPFNLHQTANLTIRSDNAFLPTALRTQLAAAGQTSFSFGTFNLDLGRNAPRNRRVVNRYVLGLNGKFGENWSWNVYGQYGRTHIDTTVGQLENNTTYRNAIDAVVSNGQIVCRSTLTTPGNGCVPYNPFGYGLNNSQAAVNYVTGTAILDLVLKQKVVAGTVQGEPFSTWAGLVSIVVGAEYREEDVGGTADSVSLANGYIAANYKPTIGSFNVKEAFFETVVPLLKDSALGRTLELNGAVRQTDYSISGSVTSWKAGLTYEPIEGIRFRGVRSRDIRAPNLSDLFLGGVVSASQTVNDPVTGTQNSGVTSTQVGSLNLVPEIAETWTGGVVLRPGFLPGLQLSVDYYDIALKGAINTLTNQQIVDRCFAGNVQLCSFITRNAANVITSIQRSPVNINVEAARGWDFEGIYRHPVGNGNVTLRALATLATARYTDDGISRDQQAGENAINSGVAKFRLVSSIAYDDDVLGAVFTSRHVSGGVYDLAYTADTLAPDSNRLPGATYFDFALRVKVGKLAGLGGAGEFFFNVDNLFNKDPAIVAPIVSQHIFAPVNPLLYDTLGRQFRTGFRVKF